MNWRERTIFMIVGLIALFGPILFGPLFIGLSIGFSKAGLSYMEPITLKSNNFVQWKLNYYLQIFFSILDIILVLFTAIVLFMTRKKPIQYSEVRSNFLQSMERAIALSLFIQVVSSLIYFNAGKSYNFFPLGYSEDQVKRIEREYGCCFPENNLAREYCECPIAKEYNTEKRFGKAKYSISQYMTKSNVIFDVVSKAKQKQYNEKNGIQPVEGTEDCGECKQVFLSTHKKLTLWPTVIGFLTLIFLLMAIYGNKYL